MTISTFSRPSFLLILDDWLRQQRFIWIGSADILLFPCSYPCAGSGFTGTTFIIDSFGSLVPKEDSQSSMFSCWWLVFLALAIHDRKPSVIGLWTFVAFHVAFGLVGFMIRPYNAITFSAPIAVLSQFLIYPLWTIRLVLCSEPWSCWNLSIYSLLARLPQLDFESISKSCIAVSYS